MFENFHVNSAMAAEKLGMRTVNRLKESGYYSILWVDEQDNTKMIAYKPLPDGQLELVKGTFRRDPHHWEPNSDNALYLHADVAVRLLFDHFNCGHFIIGNFSGGNAENEREAAFLYDAALWFGHTHYTKNMVSATLNYRSGGCLMPLEEKWLLSRGFVATSEVINRNSGNTIRHFNKLKADHNPRRFAA